MRICTDNEYRKLNAILENHSEELSIIKKVLSEPQIIKQINQEKTIVYDRIIGELLNEHLNDDTIIGTAFMLGIMQSKVLEKKKNSDQRTTANRSI